MRSASIEKLTEIKDVTEDIAKTVRSVWKASSSARLEKIVGEGLYGQLRETDLKRLCPMSLQDQKEWLIDKLIGTFGVEYLGTRNQTDVYYCNAGDPYVPTICFGDNNLFVASWGDLVETGTVKEAQY